MFQNLLGNKVLKLGLWGIIVFMAAFIIIRLIKKSKRKKELRIIAEDKMREDTLDEIIQNSHAENNGVKNLSVPYEVDYSQVNQNVKNPSADNNGCISLQLVEYNELSVRKHMIRLEKTVRIGSSSRDNTLTVADAEPNQCEIFWYNGSVYIRNTAVNHITKIRRKKKTAYVDRNGTKLQNGDLIIIGKMYFEVGII